MGKKRTFAWLACALCLGTASAAAQDLDDTRLDPHDGPMAFEALSVAGGVTVSLSGGGAGPRGELGIRFGLIPPFSSKFDLDLRLSAGVGYFESVRVPVGSSISTSSLWVDLVVQAEGVFAASDDFHIFVTAGLGGAWGRGTVDMAFIGPQHVDDGAFVIRFRGGIRYRLTGGLWLEAQPIGVTGYVGSAGSAAFTAIAGLSFETS